jgi:hypothetical protein
MALFYKYIFDFKGSELIIYAQSLVEAKMQFEDLFGEKPGELIRRETW